MKQAIALGVLAKFGGGYSAAFVGKYINTRARMSHFAASSVLASLEKKGLADCRLSQSWGKSHLMWFPTRRGRALGFKLLPADKQESNYMALSTAQIRTLKAVRDSNDAGRGLMPPNGPSSRPFKFLVNEGLLNRETDAMHFLTARGREALEQAENGKAQA